MHCHGNPGDAPSELIRLYGDTQGFGHFPGELAGIIAVGIPVDSALADIRGGPHPFSLPSFWEFRSSIFF
jgi:two-component system, NtrC family, sensor kinase